MEAPKLKNFELLHMRCTTRKGICTRKGLNVSEQKEIVEDRAGAPPKAKTRSISRDRTVQARLDLSRALSLSLVRDVREKRSILFATRGTDICFS